MNSKIALLKTPSDGDVVTWWKILAYDLIQCRATYRVNQPWTQGPAGIFGDSLTTIDTWYLEERRAPLTPHDAGSKWRVIGQSSQAGLAAYLAQPEPLHPFYADFTTARTVALESLNAHLATLRSEMRDFQNQQERLRLLREPSS